MRFCSNTKSLTDAADDDDEQPVESVPPFAIIVGAITAMGGLQYLVHGTAYGKPRAIQQDAFDRLVKARDERLKTASGGTQK
jgi:NADH dehydrogenase (ubiquinone) 1 alpha subcomplex subunit 1